MRPLRVVTCDDEPLALDRLADLLGQCDGVELVGSALSGTELFSEVTGLAPDLILLDVEMPRLDGFDIVETLSKMSWHSIGAAPLIVFVTAHPELAANAFDSGALDFISKPVRLGRLERALERARVAADQREAGQRLRELSAQLDALKLLRSGSGPEAHLWLQRKSDSIRLDVDAIDWIGAEGEYVRYHAGNMSYLQRGMLSAVTERLTPCGFVRIHRSAVVNPAGVVSLEKSRWGSLSVRLRTGLSLRVGKSFRQAAKALIS